MKTTVEIAAAADAIIAAVAAETKEWTARVEAEADAVLRIKDAITAATKGMDNKDKGQLVGVAAIGDDSGILRKLVSQPAGPAGAGMAARTINPPRPLT